MISVLTPTIRPEGLHIVQKSLAEQTYQDFEWLVEVGIPERGHDLNQAYNRMLRRAEGKLIVSVQDWIKMPEDGLEKFYEAYKEDDSKFYTAPLGKTDSLQDIEIEWDWRNKQNDSEIMFKGWELDWAAAPKEAFYEIGGFDEKLDHFWSCDNVNVAKRADLAGYEFELLQDNKAVALDHDKFYEHPFRKDFAPEFNKERMEKFEEGLTINNL